MQDCLIFLLPKLEQSAVTNATLVQMQHDAAMSLSFLSKSDRLPVPAVLSRESTGGILLTGATGFIGHYVMDHVLKSYPLTSVFVIVRGQADRISQDNKRVHVLVGDLGKPLLGVKVL